MGSKEIIADEIQRVIRKENSINTVVTNLSDYVNHINGIIINFEQISDATRDFFDDKSIYFKPNILFGDQFRSIILGLRDHLGYFRGLEKKIEGIRTSFEELKVSYGVTRLGYLFGIWEKRQKVGTLYGEVGEVEEREGSVGEEWEVFEQEED